MSGEIELKREKYTKLVTEILTAIGVPKEHALIQMDAFLDADLSGVTTHGVFRLPRYVEQIKHGYINPNPNINIIKKGSIIQVIDGDHGLGAVVSYYAMKEAVKRSEDHGMGVVAVRKSNHFGTASFFAEMASRKNKIGFVITNASPAIAPTGSLKPIIGNNPWSISVPSNLGYPITLDLANSIVAKGKMRIAIEKGEKIPFDWALNAKGEPTDDPLEALKGVILPIGDYKGYGISFMFEILAGVLAGAEFGEGMGSLDENRQRNVGHLFFSINIEEFMELEEFKSRLDVLVTSVKNAPKINEDQEIYVPGEKGWKKKQEQNAASVTISENTYTKIKGLCTELNINN